jgi:hypothetical protein
MLPQITMRDVQPCYESPRLATSCKATRRVVSFCESARVKRTLHFKDYSDDEKNATWYTQAEMSLIRHHMQCIVEKLNQGEAKDDTEDCTRGVEFRTSQRIALRRENRESAFDAVLDEQQLQRLEARHDTERLARIYWEWSNHCQVVASKIGFMDAVVAREACFGETTRTHTYDAIDS